MRYSVVIAFPCLPGELLVEAKGVEKNNLWQFVRGRIRNSEVTLLQIAYLVHG